MSFQALCTLLNFDRIIGIGGFIFAVVIYFRQSKEQKIFEEFSKKTFDLIKDQGALNQHHLIKIRNDQLFMFYEHAEVKAGYWHFKLRFETWDKLGIHINENGRTQYIDIEILGQVIDHLEEFKSSYKQGYICKILELSGENILHAEIGQKVFCYTSGEKKRISKYYHPMVDPETYYEFSISLLGSITVGSGGDTPIEHLKVHPRIKDSVIK